MSFEGGKLTPLAFCFNLCLKKPCVIEQSPILYVNDSKKMNKK